MQPDYDVSVDFLRAIYPLGPWMLTAISVDKKAIDAKTFTPREIDETRAWLAMHRQRNLYYSVNEPIVAAYEKRKLAKIDVLVAHYLHVDVDPRVGEDVESEQRRILQQLETYSPSPSVIVFSGGGYNALWRLTTPVPIAENAADEDQTIARALDLERRNWQFELDFATPDHCRDVSRILRLPGTVNRPNAEKIAKGRVPAVARIVKITEQSYALETFASTPVVSSNSPKTHAVKSDIRRLESLDHLPSTVPERLKIIIAQGHDPDDKNPSRSEPLFFTCAELVRCGVADDVILGIITDKRYLISASVLDKGSGMMRYALRQVSRARDKAFNPRLAEMNERHAVIQNWGGRCLVMSDSTDGPMFQRPAEFYQAMEHDKIVVFEKEKEKRVNVGEWWFKQDRRRVYETVVYEPALETPGRFNLDTGLSVEPTPGVLHQSYLDHMLHNICSGQQEAYDYLLRWMARVVQEPRTQSESAIVLQGARGTGKTLFVESFGHLFGRHWMTVSDNKHLTGSFNAHLAQCVFVHADEAWNGRDIRHEGVLKTLITGKTNRIEKKGVDVVSRPNYIHLMMSSNEEDVVPAGDYERRFLVLRVGQRNIQQSDYFGAMVTDLESGGYANLLHHLRSIDLSKWNVRSVPSTDALRAAQENNFAYETEWLLQKLVTGDWLDGHTKWEGPVEKKLLHADYLHAMQAVNCRRPKGERAFHRFIMKELPGTTDKQVYGKQSHHRPMVFEFPTLAKCREMFDEARGWRYPWKAVVVDQAVVAQDNVLHLPGKPFE